MAKWKENCKYDVLSVRVTEKEKQLINKLATENKKNITTTVRDLIFGSGLLINADRVEAAGRMQVNQQPVAGQL